MASNKKKLSEKEKLELYKSVVPIARVKRNIIVPENMPINNTFQLLEQLGFFILKFPAKDENLSGFHIKKSGIDCIYINSNHTLGRQYFSAWHEYYHAVTGEGGNLSFQSEAETDEIEYKAECFAGCMLMPENLVQRFLFEKGILDLEYISHKQIISMQNYFNVSYSSVITRLVQLYPDKKKSLGNRYALSKPSRAKELMEKTHSVNGNIELIRPTNDVYVSQQFFNDMKSNLEDGRISEDKVSSLIELLGNLKYND